MPKDNCAFGAKVEFHDRQNSKTPDPRMLSHLCFTKNAQSHQGLTTKKGLSS